MPYFSVRVHGKGINIEVQKGVDPAIGFLTTRMVHASSELKAEIKAKEMITAEWKTGNYYKANTGSLPTLTIEAVARKTFIDRLSFKNRGYSFYCHE